MARTINEIQEDIISRIRSTPVLAELNSTSRTSLWRLWSYIIAVSIWALEQLFDQHRKEVSALIDEKAPHSLRWYANKAKDFQYGAELVPEEDFYDNTGLSEQQVQARRIVAFSAVVEQTKGLRLKVARIVDGDLEALDPNQLAAFEAYMMRIKDAGVNPLLVESQPADSLKLSIDVYYNPLVLDSGGSRLDGTKGDPVGDAVRNYLKNLPFNGTLVLAYLVDALQQVDGVIIPHIIQAQARYGNLPYQSFDVKYNPDAGYLRFIVKTDLHLNFIPQSVIV